MNDPEIEEAVFPTASSPYVEPASLERVPLTYSEGEADKAAKEMWVDVWGSLWLRSFDGTAVCLPREHWKKLGKLVNHAAKFKPPKT